MQSILMFRFEIISKTSMKEFINNLEGNNLELTKMLVTDVKENGFEAVYVYTEVTKEKIFDFDKNEFIDVVLKKYHTIPFHFDFVNKTFDLWGNRKSSQYLITAISLALNNKIIIEPLIFKFEQAFEYLHGIDGIRVGRVRAKEIVIKDGLIADCVLNLSNDNDPFKLLNEYIDNIDNIIFELSCQEGKVGITLYKSGAITIHKNREQINDNILKLIYDLMIAAGGR